MDLAGLCRGMFAKELVQTIRIKDKNEVRSVLVSP